MADFLHAIRKTLINEGMVNGKTGYVNDPDDPGGETNYGITKKVAKSYGYTGPMKEIPEDKVFEIYRRGYWNPCKCDMIKDQIIADKLFDTAVNVGVSRAIIILQTAINYAQPETSGIVVGVDGLIGPKTLKAIDETNKNDLIMGMQDVQWEYYKRLIENNPRLKKFEKGWHRRAFS